MPGILTRWTGISVEIPLLTPVSNAGGWLEILLDGFADHRECMRRAQRDQKVKKPRSEQIDKASFIATRDFSSLRRR